jgi:ferrous iron transport protein B
MCRRPSWRGLFALEEKLSLLFSWLAAPEWLTGLLVRGCYVRWRGLCRLCCRHGHLFPLFTLLEDLGYLPRIAFNLDNFFARPARTANSR